MPIDADQFDDIDDDGPVIDAGTNAHAVLSFLLENADEAFRQGEIAEATGVKTGSISVVLSRLDDRDLVRHRGEYWTVEDPEHVRRAVESGE